MCRNYYPHPSLCISREMTYTADLGTAIVLSCKQSFPICFSFIFFSFPPAPLVSSATPPISEGGNSCYTFLWECSTIRDCGGLTNLQNIYSPESESHHATPTKIARGKIVQTDSLLPRCLLGRELQHPSERLCCQQIEWRYFTVSGGAIDPA